MCHQAWWKVTYFLEHLDLFLAIHLPLEYIVARLLFLEPFEQILIFFSDPDHLFLANVFIQRL